MQNTAFILTSFWRRYRILICLVFAGELIFSLPFHVARFFRPTLLSTFELSNTDLGYAFAVYGFTAMLAYVPGGMLADRFSARKLMSLSLFFTALGGVYMLRVPGYLGLSLLYGYWGITSIFLFWAAMIRATREWGGDATQGSAFGLLDGGRGLVAAVTASTAVALFTLLVPTGLAEFTDASRTRALQMVIAFYSLMTLVAALVVWFVVPDTESSSDKRRFSIANVFFLLKRKTLWLQAIIVVCAYCAYKGLDNFSLYAVDAMGFDEIEAAQYSAYVAYLRVFAAITAGFLANRFFASKVILFSFLLLIVSYALLAYAVPEQFNLAILYGNIVVTYCAVFALRGVYFALLHEAQTAQKNTGTAVGIISFVGFTPDMFFTPLAGSVLDAAPGLAGHQNFFLILVFISILGFIATFILRKISAT